MDKETIKLILQFMQRVQLTGQEVPAFNKCVSVLSEELNKPIVVEEE
jgi:hypothetical protein